MSADNKVFLLGRLTATPELKNTPNDINVLSFTVAINKQTNKDHPEANFIDCVAWRTTAEFISKYFEKGSRIALWGSLQTRTYEDKDGKKRKVTEVIVDEVTFAERKPEGKDSENQIKPETVTESTNTDDDLPF